MNEIEALKSISETLDKLMAEERSRVVNWVVSKFGGSTPAPVQNLRQTPVTGPNKASEDSREAPIATRKAKVSKKAKTIISMDKSLNLAPQGQITAIQFAAAKSPSNAKEKSVVAVHYLRDVVGVEKVTVEGVFTFFKSVQWPAPTDLKNTLQQAGSDGWLDTADSGDIKLTSLGENIVEHTLPRKQKT